MASSRELLLLIGHYLAEVKMAVNLLHTEFGRDDLLNAANMRQIPRDGKIGTEAEYHFHGIGCEFSRSGVTIDFDFEPNDRHDGFDAWRLHLFASHMIGLTSFAELKRTEDGLKDLLQEGLISASESMPGDHLYHLTEMGTNELNKIKK